MKIKLLRILSICLVLSITSMGVAFGESKEDLDEPVSTLWQINDRLFTCR
jgi:hypothetical protein